MQTNSSKGDLNLRELPHVNAFGIFNFYEVIFNWMLKVTRDYFGFPLIQSDWSWNLMLSSETIKRKRQTKTNRHLVTHISRSFGSLPVFTLSPHWLIMTQTFDLSGCRS